MAPMFPLSLSLSLSRWWWVFSPDGPDDGPGDGPGKGGKPWASRRMDLFDWPPLPRTPPVTAAGRPRVSFRVASQISMASLPARVSWANTMISLGSSPKAPRVGSRSTRAVWPLGDTLAWGLAREGTARTSTLGASAQRTRARAIVDGAPSSTSVASRAVATTTPTLAPPTIAVDRGSFSRNATRISSRYVDHSPHAKTRASCGAAGTDNDPSSSVAARRAAVKPLVALFFVVVVV
mmetsp:Transcript_9870/g.32142  ORF Transcript_9870/g.32142 Transcript_9870/m.32142 type:complete len:236 (+) Transcript_9870:1257-1964(+)